MELSKKTTILFPPDQYGQLARLAQQRKTSVGKLVRDACRVQYRLSSRDERRALVSQLATLNLPVGSPAKMKSESAPDVESLP